VETLSTIGFGGIDANGFSSVIEKTPDSSKKFLLPRQERLQLQKGHNHFLLSGSGTYKLSL
jgi:hypothetical protein